MGNTATEMMEIFFSVYFFEENMGNTPTDIQDVLLSDLVNDGTFSASIFSRRTWGTQQLK